MHRSLVVARVLVVCGVVAAVLTGCSQSSTPTSDTSCGGAISKVLLADDSATTVTAFDQADVPKIFGIVATPAPTCYYKDVTNPAATNGVSLTVTHRTLLYIGLSDADAAALVASVRATASVAPWTVEFDNPPPAAPVSPAPTPESVTSSADWNYNAAGAATDDKGELGFYEATPVAPGTATRAGLTSALNVVRIETDLRQVKK